jgi:ribosomal protein S18 acetylase RimI-like enzyme
MDLRLAEPADLDLIRTMADEYYAFDHLEIDSERATAAVRELLADRSLGQIWLVFDGTEPAGYLVLAFGYSIEFGGKDAFIDELYLREQYRGRGWGKAVMESAATAARNAGVRALHLEVTRENARALRLYESVGFVDHDRFLMTKRIS